MLLDTKRGKENKVVVPVGTEPCQKNHTYTKDGGYQEVPYVHQEYPKMLYKKRELAVPTVVNLLDDLVGVKDKDDRQDIYVQALLHIGEAGVDIRSWPMTAPTDAMLKAMKSVLTLHARDQARDEWLSQNPTQARVDYARFINAPEMVTVNNRAEEMELAADGWCTTPTCELPPVPAGSEDQGN